MEPDFDDVVEIWEKRFQDDQLTPECFKVITYHTANV
jgi:hypothetical protein